VRSSTDLFDKIFEPSGGRVFKPSRKPASDGLAYHQRDKPAPGVARFDLLKTLK
jgi:hypothetical protein